MEGAAELRVPLVVDTGVGKTGTKRTKVLCHSSRFFGRK
jgi:hypothetical protein